MKLQDITKLQAPEPPTPAPPPGQQSYRLLMALTLASFLLVLTMSSVLYLPSSRDGGAAGVSAPVRPARTAADLSAPRLAVDRDVIDLGDVKYQQEARVAFVLTNAGDRPLAFKERPYLEVLEGCCPPDVALGAMALKPGESTQLSMQFMMHEGMGGKHLFRVHVKTNDPALPERTLDVASNWVP